MFPVGELKELILSGQPDSKGGPLKIGVHFVRQSKTKFDFHNLVQVIFDLMVAFDIIEDDNMDCILPFPMEIDGKWHSVNKNKPGAWIAVI